MALIVISMDADSEISIQRFQNEDKLQVWLNDLDEWEMVTNLLEPDPLCWGIPGNHTVFMLIRGEIAEEL